MSCDNSIISAEFATNSGKRASAVEAVQRPRSDNVLNCLARLFTQRSPSQRMRTDNAPEFIAWNIRNWLDKLKVTNLYIEPRSPWENG